MHEASPARSLLISECGAGVYEVARTNAGGLADLTFTPTEAGRLTITVSEGHEHSGDPGMQHTPALPMQRTYYIECWREMASLLDRPSYKNVRWGAWLTYDDSSGLVFAAKGNNRTDFYSYDPEGDTWHPLPLWPVGAERKKPRRGSAACCDGHGHVFAAKGNNTMGFWRYDLSDSSWHQLEDVPLARGNKKVKDGTCVTYVQAGDTGYVYLAKGQTTEFFRYNTGSGLWSACQSISGREKLKAGSFLVYDGVGSIYAHEASYDVMYRYDLADSSWHGPLAGMPLIGADGRRTAKDGGCGAWQDGCIYALKGNNSRQFWQYFPESDSWGELDTIPLFGSTNLSKRVRQGGSIVSVPGFGFFAFKGNNCRECWFHPVLNTGGALAGVPRPGGTVAAGGGPTLGEEEPLMDGLEASKPRWNAQGDMVCYSKEDTLTGFE